MSKPKKSTIGFRVDGFAPTNDIAWIFAGERGQLAFWREVARLSLRVKDRSLARGLDIRGETMVISEETRRHRHSAMGKARASAPALTPARRLSRTRSYLRAHVERDGVWLFWRFDHRTGGSWGRILEYQAAHNRNVIGLSDADREEVIRGAMRWWKANRVRWAVFGAGQQGRTVSPNDLIGARPAPRVALPPVAPGLRDVAGVSGRQQVREAAERGTFSGFRRSPGPATDGPFRRAK